ncbi:MAG: MATE family efflux transporter [Flavonifractor plautii]
MPCPCASILMIGVPTALQSVMYNASNIVIQASINSFGTDAVAAWTAYGKMDIIFWMTITAMAQSITTFAGQNYGAGEYERLKKGVRVSVAMTACFTVLLSTAFFLLARPLLAIFSPDPDVLEVGVEMVRFLAPCYITYILIELLTGAIRGAGKSVAPMLISVFGVCGLRSAVAVHRRARPPHPAGCGGQLPHHLGGHLRGHPALLPLRPVAPPAQEGVKAPPPYFAGDAVIAEP